MLRYARMTELASKLVTTLLILFVFKIQICSLNSLVYIGCLFGIYFSFYFQEVLLFPPMKPKHKKKQEDSRKQENSRKQEDGRKRLNSMKSWYLHILLFFKLMYLKIQVIKAFENFLLMIYLFFNSYVSIFLHFIFIYSLLYFCKCQIHLQNVWSSKNPRWSRTKMGLEGKWQWKPKGVMKMIAMRTKMIILWIHLNYQIGYNGWKSTTWTIKWDKIQTTKIYKYCL